MPIIIGLWESRSQLKTVCFKKLEKSICVECGVSGEVDEIHSEKKKRFSIVNTFIDQNPPPFISYETPPDPLYNR